MQIPSRHPSINVSLFFSTGGMKMSTYHDNPTTPESANDYGTYASRSTEGLRDQVQEAGREVVHKAQELSEQGQELASEYYQQGREQALVWQKRLEQQIREKPIQSLVMAGGVGLLLGLLWRR
jgi:ElaB/YqjD/DUF883 family membrane-anchored ribosome-binding protein